MAEARIPENFGDTQIRVQALDFVGLGLRMPREAWRLPSPQMLHSARPFDRLWYATVLACRIPMCLHIVLNHVPTN